MKSGVLKSVIIWATCTTERRIKGCLDSVQWEWWNSGMVEWWNGGMDACVVSSTFLVHVGSNCIRVVAEISIMGRFWHERYL